MKKLKFILPLILILWLISFTNATAVLKTLRPNAAGDLTELNPYPSAPNYANVNDAVPDDDSYNYVAQPEGSKEDLYNVGAFGESVDSIEGITVYTRCKCTVPGSDAVYLYIKIKTGGSIYSSVRKSVESGSWETDSNAWATNPETEVAWTASDLESLQIGADLNCIFSGEGRCSNTYVVVNYTELTLPDQVTGVSATDGVHTDKVVITWDAADRADKYYVWTGAEWVDVGDVQTYDHTTAPAPTITVGTAYASDGTSASHVVLNIEGQSANNGSSVNYKVKAWNTYGYGAESDIDAGYRGVGSLTYQWLRSSGDADADYSEIVGGTTDPYNDTGAPENGDGRYFKCEEDATGAAQQTTNADRGYRLVLEDPAFNYFGYNLNP